MSIFSTLACASKVQIHRVSLEQNSYILSYSAKFSFILIFVKFDYSCFVIENTAFGVSRRQNFKTGPDIWI